MSRRELQTLIRLLDRLMEHDRVEMRSNTTAPPDGPWPPELKLEETQCRASLHLAAMLKQRARVYLKKGKRR